MRNERQAVVFGEHLIVERGGESKSVVSGQWFSSA